MPICFNAMREGNAVIRLTEHTITNCKYEECSETGSCLLFEQIPNKIILTGKILLLESNVIIQPDESDEDNQILPEEDYAKKLVLWARMRGDKNCYLDVHTVTNAANGLLAKEVFLKDAYITSYKEVFDHKIGALQFTAVMRERTIDLLE